MFWISFPNFLPQTCSAVGRVPLLVIHGESRQTNMSQEEAFKIVAWQMPRETLPILKGSWRDCPKAGMEEAGDWVSCLVTQCCLVKIKGHEVRVMGNQGRDNTDNCAWHVFWGSQRSAVHTNSGCSSRAVEGGRLYCFSFTAGDLVVLEEVSLSQIVNYRGKLSTRANRFSDLWC